MKIAAKNILWRIWLPIIILGIWQIIASLEKNPFFPAPLRIWSACLEVAKTYSVLDSLKSSLLILLSGYLLGALIGVFVGSLMGEFYLMRKLMLPASNFIRSIPSVAKVPLIMALMGLGTATRITAVCMAVLFPVLMSTVRAVATTKQELLDVAKTMKYGRIQSLITIKIPAATGEILTGLHAAVQVALLTMILSEMLGSGIGIGAFIIQSQSTFRIANMWVGIFVVGIIGLFLNFLFLKLERKFAPWYFESRGLN
jgi:ABC-type nitrate/sulfonate/bicarbonate transport system permease component